MAPVLIDISQLRAGAIDLPPAWAYTKSASSATQLWFSGAQLVRASSNHFRCSFTQVNCAAKMIGFIVFSSAVTPLLVLEAKIISESLGSLF
jgi:hypothetical protein